MPPFTPTTFMHAQVRVLKERNFKMKGQAKTQEKDIQSHETRMGEIQARRY